MTIKSKLRRQLTSTIEVYEQQIEELQKKIDYYNTGHRDAVVLTRYGAERGTLQHVVSDLKTILAQTV